MTELLAQQFRNDKEKRVVIPENLRSRFIRDPGNALVLHVDSLDSGYSACGGIPE